ncbi:MAG TPA: mechanosensitive ion channel family protein, partial [Verrucomicrobiae bacterium]|nr:mechanosensitive ion channel family protein [Verrucomicrobiae bacterium]
FAVLNILSLIGISTTTILASASILGLAVGFGAQSLVKDIISGFFIIFEDQFAVGEFVRTDKYEGIVEEIGLRATKLRDWGGELHIIPNGTIASVTNFNRGKMRSMVDINVPYDDDIEKAMDIIGQIGKEMAEEFKHKFVEVPKVQGIINLGEAFVVIRMIAYTHPMEQWEMEREMRRRVVRALTREGIRVPALRKVFVEKG